MKNPYDVLGVNKKASKDEIRRAFRKKAQAAHPDRQGGSADAMTEVNRAYGILADDRMRERFDQTGQTDQPKPIDTMAYEIVQQLFLKFIENMGDGADLIDAMRNDIRNGRDGCKMEAKKASDLLARIQRRAKRVQGGDMFATVLEHRVRQLKAQIEDAGRKAEVAERALEMLNGYSDPVPQNQRQAAVGWGSLGQTYIAT